jgi:hypothetical protein
MSVATAELRMMPPPAATIPAATMPVIPPADAQAGSGHGESFLHHIWEVINPLQHLPVVGTIYRAITGEHIGDIEKIAGDALYGGLWGAVTSVADVAFEHITGHSAEDTVLALFKHDDANSGVAAAKVQPRMAVNAPLPDAAMPDLPQDPASKLPGNLELAALTQSLSAKGVDSDTAARALYAYRRTMGMSTSYVPVVASLN